MVSSDRRLLWVDGLKAFAIIGIILNHFVESFGSFPWFSNPSYNWPDVATRLSSVFPSDGSPGWRLVQFLGWLGDMGPGIFILVSGFTLTLSSLNRSEKDLNIREFYLKRFVRIFPLYLVIHLLVIFFAVMLRAGIGFDSSRVCLSMLGLRFTDKLFFYINPSWWFIWLILQLYIVFPILYRLLQGKGIKSFIIITLVFTLVSRLAGLLNLTWSVHLEYWMTGIFAGTRLSEFAAGMILAKLLFEKKFDPVKINPAILLLLSSGIYVVGFVSSLFYVSTLISNTLITIGLAGIFLIFIRIIEAKLSLLINAVKWTGMVSFPVFLLHQPLMLWTGNGFTGINKGIVETFVLIIVFPAAWFIDKVVNNVIRKIPEIRDRLVLILFGSVVILQVLLNIIYFITGNELIYKADVIFFITSIFFIPLYVFFRAGSVSLSFKSLLFNFIIASAIFIVVLTKNWFSIFWIVLLLMVIFRLFLSFLSDNFALRIIIPIIIVSVLIIVAEIFLNLNHPVEVNRWGELPALQRDPVTTYSLIPNRITRLKYNNYDYPVKTNSLGFNGPETMVSEKSDRELRILIIGDAFTMPEGMEYEKAYPELLREQISKKYPDREIIIFNAGVTGYGPNEMYAQLEKYIDTLKPDIFINQIFINEFEEINISEEQRLNSIGLREDSFREIWLSGSQVPQHIRSGFHRIINDKSFRKYTYNKSLLHFYEVGTELYNTENISRMRDYFRNVFSLCEIKSCLVAILYAPGQMEISSPDMISYFPWHLPVNDSLKYDFELPLNTLARLCNEAELAFLDPSDILKKHPTQPVYFRESWHWNEEGHKVIADFLSGYISNLIDQ